MHCSFSRLFVCFARVSRTVCSLDCLFVTQESRALSVLWIVIQESRALSVLWIVFFVSQGSSALFVLWIVRLWRESLAHGLFSGLFVCYQESRALSVLWIVIQESRALFVLWIVCLLRESLAHCRFSGLFVCNARVSCTIFSLDCLFVTQEFRALFFLLDSLSFSLTNLFFNGLEFCTVVF